MVNYFTLLYLHIYLIFKVRLTQCAVAHAILLGAHYRYSYAEIPSQCEADMSRKSASHQEETGVLGT